MGKLVQGDTWGFTKISTSDFEDLQAQGRLIDCGVHVKIANGRGAINSWDPENLWIRWDVLRNHAERQAKKHSQTGEAADEKAPEVEEDDDDEDEESTES